MEFQPRQEVFGGKESRSAMTRIYPTVFQIFDIIVAIATNVLAQVFQTTSTHKQKYIQHNKQ